MRKKTLKKATLKKLYITEEKSLATIAQMLSCSPPTVRSRCLEYGIKIREAKGGKRADKVLRTVFFDERQLERLNRLSTMTRVPRAVYFREAIDVVLAKHEKQLKGKHQKREG